MSGYRGGGLQSCRDEVCWISRKRGMRNGEGGCGRGYGRYYAICLIGDFSGEEIPPKNVSEVYDEGVFIKKEVNY